MAGPAPALRRPRRPRRGAGAGPAGQHPAPGRDRGGVEPRRRALVEPVHVGARDRLRRGPAHPVGSGGDAGAHSAGSPLLGGPRQAAADGIDARPERRPVADALLLGPREDAGRARARIRHLPRHLGGHVDGRPRLPDDRAPHGRGRPLAPGDPGRAAVLEPCGRVGRRPARGRDDLGLPPAAHLERALGQPVRTAGADEDRAGRPAPRPGRVQQPLRGAAPEGGGRLRPRAAALPADRRGRGRRSWS